MCLPSGVVSAAAVWLVTLGHVSRQTARSRPPGLWNILYWIICFVFSYRVHTLATGSQLTCSHGVRPLSARGLATTADQVSLFQGCHASSVCVRERWRGWPSRPLELVENSFSTVTHSLTAIAQRPLGALRGIHNKPFSTHQHHPNPPEKRPLCPRQCTLVPFPPADGDDHITHGSAPLSLSSSSCSSSGFSSIVSGMSRPGARTDMARTVSTSSCRRMAPSLLKIRRTLISNKC